MASVGREQDHLVLWRLYVLPEHHGQGIGSALLASGAGGGRQGRYAEIRLSYTEGNTPRRALLPDPRVSSRPTTRRAGARCRTRSGCRAASRDGIQQRPMAADLTDLSDTAAGDRAGRPRGSAVMTGRPDSAQRQAAEQLDLRKRMREVEEAILARAPEHDLEPSLDRIAAVMELLGDPQRAFPVIHLTGTNGKTSTTRIIERAAARDGPEDRAVHLAAPARHARADRPERRADRRREVPRGLRRGAAVHRDGRRPLGRRGRPADDLLRGRSSPSRMPRSPTRRSTSPSSRSGMGGSLGRDQRRRRRRSPS